MNTTSLSNRHRQPVANGRVPEMDHLLDRVFGSFDFTPAQSPFQWPAIEVRETDNEFRLSVDLPGVEQRDVELGFHDGALSLKAHRETSQSDTRYSTRWSGSFERVINVGQDVDADRIGASLKNGVLTVTLPKKPEHQPRRIQIE